LAQVLIKNPDILMLDEPTNHLDILSIRWLELFLQSYKKLVIVVSHDKRFLENICTKILDIDFATITEYSGNYSDFEKSRRLFLLQKEKEILAQQKEIAKKQDFIDRFKAKASKARQAQSRIKQIEKIVIEEPLRSTRVHPSLRFDIEEPGSKEVLEVKNLSKAYNNNYIIKNFTMSVKRGDKIAIIGPNGSGKSTLIKALNQEFPECNKFIKWGHGVEIGYFAQDCGKNIKASDLSVLEWLWQFCADKAQSFVQGLLGRVLFSGEDSKKATKSLSGGELSRLYLAYLMLKKPSVMLLDEPTNHLDLESISSLANALMEYKGTLIAVSHDRDFIDSIFSRIIELSATGSHIEDFLGSYSEFIAYKNRDYLDAHKESKLKKNHTEQSHAKFNYEEQKARKSQAQKLKKQLDKIILEVEELEKEIKNLDNLFSDPNFFIENSREHVRELDNKKNNLEEKLSLLITQWENIEQELLTIN
jgi:ATPase subunit of ABC transporter with duplicated ATPase domains